MSNIIKKGLIFSYFFIFYSFTLFSFTYLNGENKKGDWHLFRVDENAYNEYTNSTKYIGVNFLTKDVENAMNYLKTNSQGKTFLDMPTQQRQEYFTSQEYMYKNSEWNPNIKEFYYVPTYSSQSNEILVNQLSEQTWYERQKGAQERFDIVSMGGDGLASYGTKIGNPYLMSLGSSISFGATTLSNMVSPDKTDAEMINGYLPWYFQLTDLNPKIEEEK